MCWPFYRNSRSTAPWGPKHPAPAQPLTQSRPWANMGWASWTSAAPSLVGIADILYPLSKHSHTQERPPAHQPALRICPGLAGQEGETINVGPVSTPVAHPQGVLWLHECTYSGLVPAPQMRKLRLAPSRGLEGNQTANGSSAFYRWSANSATSRVGEGCTASKLSPFCRGEKLREVKGFPQCHTANK